MYSYYQPPMGMMGHEQARARGHNKYAQPEFVKHTRSGHFAY